MIATSAARKTPLELLVDAATARALSNPADRDLMGELVMRLVMPWDSDDPLQGILDGEVTLRRVAARPVTGLTAGQIGWLLGHPILGPLAAERVDPASVTVTVADIVAAVERVIGSPMRARRWLLRPHSRLGGRPVDLLDTNDGAMVVVAATLTIEGTLLL